VLIVIPAIAEGSGELVQRLGLALAKRRGAPGAALFRAENHARLVSHRCAPPLAEFSFSRAVITLGLAWLTQRAGLSLALGAFLAGMLISET